MKVCFVIADITCSGGIERVLNVLTSKFQEENHEVSILSLYRTNEKLPYKFSKNVTIDYLNEDLKYSGSPASFTRFKMHLKSLCKIRKYIKNGAYDTVIFNGFPMSFLGYFCSGVKNKIAVEHVHYGYYRHKIRLLRHYIYKEYNSLVVLTEHDKDSFQKDGLNNVKLIGNPKSFSSEIKSNLSSKRVITVGRLEEQKGYDLLIPIFEEVNLEFPDWELVIFGTGTLKEQLAKMIEDSNCPRRISLKGKTDKIVNEYLSSSVFVMSSRYEGFGMVLVEAMECGLPCISFDCPNGPSDIIDHRENGYLVKPGDSKDMVKKLKEIISDTNKRKSFSDDAVRKASEFDIDLIYSKWSRII